MFSTLQSASFNPKLEGTGAKLGMDDATSDTEGSLFASELEAVESNIENTAENNPKPKGKYIARLESSFISSRLEVEAKPEPKMAKLHESEDEASSDVLAGEMKAISKLTKEVNSSNSKLIDDSELANETGAGTDFYSFVTSSLNMNTQVKSLKRDPLDSSLVASKDSTKEGELLIDDELLNDEGDLTQSQMSFSDIKQTKELNKELLAAKEIQSSQSINDQSQQLQGASIEPSKALISEIEQSASRDFVVNKTNEANSPISTVLVEQTQVAKKGLMSNLNETNAQLTSQFDVQNQATKEDLKNLADEGERLLASALDRSNQAEKSNIGSLGDKAKKIPTSVLNGQTLVSEKDTNAANENVTELPSNNSRKDAQLFLDKAMAKVSGDVEKSAIAKAVAEQLEKTQVQSDEALSVKDAVASLKSENDIRLGKDTLASLDIGKKEVSGKEVVSDTKSTTQGFDLNSSVKNASPSIKGIGVNVAALETELNQLSMAQREALQVDLKDKLTQGALTPAEQTVLKSVLTALQLSGDDKISLEVKQFVSAKAQDQEVKLSQASALPNDNAKLVDTMTKADVQGLIKGLNEPVETVGKDTKATFNLAETVGKDTKASVNPAQTEQLELKLGSTDAIGQRQTGASDPVNSKKSDDKTESLVTVNVPLAKKSEDNLEQGIDNLEPLLDQEQEALIASQNTTQQQAKMADSSAAFQRIMQTVTQIAHNNTQFDNAVNVQVFQQIEQVQQQQHSVAHAHKVVMDPAMLEAINIARHDAVKELQNRVSMMLNLNNKEAEIRLDPPELGSLQIRIRTDAETAQVNFVVQNQQAKELLEQSLPKLREMLAEQGINLGESSIEHGSSGQGNTGEGSGKGMNTRVDSDQVEESAAENLRTTAKTSSSAIDYYA